MAGLADVSNALVALIAQIAYPNGTSQPSITGQGVKVYAGWPVPAVLTADLKAGKAHVSVFPRAVKYLQSAKSKWAALTAAEHTVTLTVAGQAVTVGGTISTPQNVSLWIDGHAYPYAVQTGDTLTTIATALAALISVDQPATSAGAVVTIPGAKDISPRVGGMATRIRDVRRQDQEFLITVWANCHETREPLGDALDVALASRQRLTLPDGSFANLRSRPLSNPWDDSGQKEGIYRRDLCCWVEYATTEVQEQYEVTQGEVIVSDDLGTVLRTKIL
ncbi:hypothetical protein [Cupriavidus taiwanensis]|uniref:hypothetical protein n=1 Tax=Cupriavidus taiwanensis TaxID=164546 RepID=UPI000E1044B0|nr:hypothetical protein [Cupriavidus taiwanensis]SOY56852.1 putative phage protein [Cupriavidus taiwanensis]SOY90789.1 putative phage protein [Cupriavidus taiwanensis]SOZ63561.1 putative phage protein [Cupriavidus taiwanensis]SOZ82600.1 putative phage protein [Cupriavidus taiwanensis]SOZ84445.1 putative phage protein [Cupriavidus taiwanensis]